MKRRRAHSLDSGDPNPKKGKENTAKPLNEDQTRAVEAAVSILKPEQQELIQRRQQKIATQHRESSPRETGLSNPKSKGKGIDPREWGNMNISQESLNVEAQAAALDSYTQQSKQKNKPSKKKGSKRRLANPKCREAPVRPAESSANCGEPEMEL